MNRRQLLKLCTLSASSLYFSRTAKGFSLIQSTQSPASPPSIVIKTADPAKYIDPLPIPQRMASSMNRHGVREYEVYQRQFKQKLHSQLPPTSVWGYDGKYPGPILEARVNEPVDVIWRNELPRQHLFAIDPRLHGAMPPAPEVRTSTHLHGAHTASEDDGLPEKWIRTGESVRFHYPNRQCAATLWYHDHALGITRLNNYAGLSGFYFLRDEHEADMNLPSGPYEIPLMIQDRQLSPAGDLIYAPSSMANPVLPPGVWGPEFFGNVPVINGAIYPYLSVEPRRYRLRVVNAANARFFSLFLSDPSIPFSNVGLGFVQIGTDGGFLPRPVEATSVVLGPAERADLVVDFSGHAGKNLILSNYAPAPFPGSGGDDSPMKAAPMRELMQIRVAARTSTPDNSSKPSWSIPMERLDGTQAVRVRDLIFNEHLDSGMNSLGVKINEAHYADPTTEKPRLNTMEMWRFVNLTDDTHPMHVHLVQFQIAQRVSFHVEKFNATKQLDFFGAIRLPEKTESGWKDTVRVNPGEVVSILLPFSGYTGKYVYHCHMLEHEDNDMMRPFEVMS